MGRVSRRCARPGCRAWAMRGQEYCRAHRGLEDRAPPVEDDAREASEAFAARLASGRYRELFERQVAAVLAEAGQDVSLADEIGALRLAMAKVLAEEDDPARLAASISRIVDAVVRAVKAQRTLSGAMAEGLTEAMTAILIELGLDET